LQGRIWKSDVDSFSALLLKKGTRKADRNGGKKSVREGETDGGGANP